MKNWHLPVLLAFFALVSNRVNCQVFANGDPDSLYIHVDSAIGARQKILTSIKGHMKVKSVTIANSVGWTLYSYGAGNGGVGIVNSNAAKIDELPNEVTKMSNLEKLKISELGLKKLPDRLGRLKRLRTLDISFNNINLAEEQKKLMRLRRLETLKVYGIVSDFGVFLKLTNANPNLNIRYTDAHFRIDNRNN